MVATRPVSSVISKFQVYVDGSAPGSLDLIQKLDTASDNIAHIGGNVYEVETSEKAILPIISSHEDAVLKFEAM